MNLDFVIILVGLVFSRVLFSRFTLLEKGERKEQFLKLSVIIPARNEEKNLPLLLTDLKNQTVKIHEIICVDDDSDDDTAKIASFFGATLITLKNKPEGWIGKSWACQKGAEAASGDLFLFLDADVRLSSLGINKLLNAYEGNRCTISVQPYHKTENRYEQFSLFFNFVQFAGNGLGLPFENKNAGLFGPVILMSRSDYYKVGGHESIKSSIIDDVALGEKLKQKNIPFKLFQGDQDISFRMYSGGFKDLIQGWTKNQAAGAMKSPLLIFIMVFLWVGSCTSVPVNLINSIAKMDLPMSAVYLILYCIWVVELRRIAWHIGNFKIGTIIAYPIFLAFYLGVFLLSLVKKIFHLKVIWKKRKI